MHKLRCILALLLAALLLFTCAAAEQAAPQTQWLELGKGKNQMTVIVVFPDQTTKGYHISSNCKTLMGGLMELDLIQVEKTDGQYRLIAVDGVSLPEDDPDAYWFVAMYDQATESLVPMTQPFNKATLAGQTYALGMITGGQASE